MADFAVDEAASALRNRMADELRRRTAVITAEVDGAVRMVPRHSFLPSKAISEVYAADRAIPTRCDAHGVPVSSSSAPTIMAVMLERLAPRTGMRVLEVGTGTGYNAGLLSVLVGPDGLVVSIELDAEIAAEARSVLSDLQLPRNVEVRAGDAWLGAPDRAPFDPMIVTAGLWDLSPAWIAQLREGGRLVAPLWIGPGLELAVCSVRDGDRLRSTSVDYCGFMRLRGEHAGPEHAVQVGEWITTVVHRDSDALAVLERLLETPGQRQHVPAPPEGWFARLAISDPDAVALSHLADPSRYMIGVFDATEPSLALVNHDELVVWNDNGSAANRLTSVLTGEPLDLTQITIEVAPLDTTAASGAIVIPRRDHQLTIVGLR